MPIAEDQQLALNEFLGELSEQVTFINYEDAKYEFLTPNEFCFTCKTNTDIEFVFSKLQRKGELNGLILFKTVPHTLPCLENDTNYKLETLVMWRASTLDKLQEAITDFWKNIREV